MTVKLQVGDRVEKYTTTYKMATFNMNGNLLNTQNGYPVWKDLFEEHSIWYENGKWKEGILSKGAVQNNVLYRYFTSDTSADCPESVESWSGYTDLHGDWTKSVADIKSGIDIVTSKLCECFSIVIIDDPS